MAQTIDGFMPRTAALPHLAPRPRSHTAPAQHHPRHHPATPVSQPERLPVRPQQRVARLSAPVAAAPPGPPIAVAPARRTYAAPAPVLKRRRGIPERLQLPLIIIGCMLAGIFAQSAVFGQLMVVAYGIAALVWHIASRTTFTLALLSMVATTLLLVVRGNATLAQNFATYTFLLLVVGVITLTGELKKEGGRIYSNRKNIT